MRKRDLIAKQKTMGIVAIILGVCSVPIEMDGTFAIIAVPLGLYMLFTKNIIITDIR